MLEVLPKNLFLGHQWGWLTLGKNDTLGTYLAPKHVLRCIERQAAFYGLLCTRSQGTKKAREVANSPLPPPYTPEVAYLNFGMWSRLLDIINLAKF